jgi:hypothetical protein
MELGPHKKGEASSSDSHLFIVLYPVRRQWQASEFRAKDQEI